MAIAFETYKWKTGSETWEKQNTHRFQKDAEAETQQAGTWKIVPVRVFPKW